ncbi:uncharacterized protein LTR77_002289 [Saxophila tyrrhenica]|uniref:DUF7707 domain-containing protein n=1 Tax=Saxophila tyrrhenica TaxID=1690608 RepID=A0AAV9PLK7_9PEZI|nr:hypothetical protein LTR77_002289 [Saxophila tyrrhenica]
MFYSTLLIAATTLLGAASAQNTTTGPIEIDPNSVNETTRQTWCNYQQQNCPLVCGGRGNLEENNCDASDLTWDCTCVSNTPNITSFTNMIPSLECGVWVEQCVAAAGNDLNALTACRSVQCGSRDPGSVDSAGSSSGGSSNSGGSSSSMAASSASASATGGSGGSGNSPSMSSSASAAASSTGAAVALNVAKNYGTGIVAAGMLGVFGLAL